MVTQRKQEQLEMVFELVQRHSVREYYDRFTGKGLGGKDFSWTAALVIDMIHNHTPSF